MIKVFMNGSKVNVVDDKNNLVGFGTDDDCCAHGGWFISREKVTEGLAENENKNDEELSDYIFDTDFFEEHKPSEVDEGGLVIFRMVAPDKPDLFLHLFNMHNGYYGKGFNSSFKGDGVL